MWLNFAIVFVAMTVVDFLYGRYTIAASDRKAVAASVWGTGIVFANSVVVIEYINNHWMILAAALGSAFGTYISIKTKKD